MDQLDDKVFVTVDSGGEGGGSGSPAPGHQVSVTPDTSGRTIRSERRISTPRTRQMTHNKSNIILRKSWSREIHEMDPVGDKVSVTPDPCVSYRKVGTARPENEVSVSPDPSFSEIS